MVLKLLDLAKVYLWQKYHYAIAATFMLTPNFWSVQYILMALSGEFAPILPRQNYGSQMIPKVTIPRWKQNVAGIRFLQANVPNVAHHSRECGYHQSNGAANAVTGKMIYKCHAKYDIYSLRSPTP
jgi:hypothetical protein